jgi:GNAT superfamily N-acetyltransferase
VIVEARPEHFDAFRDLNLEWIDAYFEREPNDLALLSDPSEAILARGGQIFVAFHDHEIVGVCAVMPCKAPGDYELTKMAVREKSRGLGAGRALMQAAETWCQHQAARRIVIITNSALHPAVRLYETSGYERIHSGPHPSYKRADLIFAKGLTQK